jgi:hypothetical protein
MAAVGNSAEIFGCAAISPSAEITGYAAISADKRRSEWPR